MKVLTKEWVKNLEFHELIVLLDGKSNKKIPFVILNGGEGVAEKDLHTLKTNFNLTEKENEISFVMLPEAFYLDPDFALYGKSKEDRYASDFHLQYSNRLRVISYLPEEILKSVKDKRLLAFGYAEERAKKEILKFIKSKYRNAVNLFEKTCSSSVMAEEGLTILGQLKGKHLNSVLQLFDGSEVTKAETEGGEIFLTLDDDETLVFSGAQVLEEEAKIARSFIRATELYKKEDGYELHLLIKKTDKNLIESYHYVTYAFKDLKLKN